MSAATTAHILLRPPRLPDYPAQPQSQPAFLFKLFLAALLTGIAIQLTGPRWLKSVFLANHLGAVENLIVLLLAIAVTVILHELGHLIPSLCFGFHVSRISLGPISIMRSGDRWKLQYSRAWFSGSVSAIPPDSRAWRKRMLVVVAAGPFASVCVFLLAAYLANHLTGNTLPAGFARALAQTNFFISIFGFIPNAANVQVRNDARLFWTIFEDRGEAEQIKLYHLVTQLQITGVRPRDYPEDLIGRAAVSSGSLELMLFSAHTVYLWALDSGLIATAGEWDRHSTALLDRRPLRLSNPVLCESAWFDLIHRNCPVSALNKIRAAKLKTLPHWLRCRTKAVEQLALEQDREALMHLKQARATLSGARPYFAFESRLLDALEEKAVRRSNKAKLPAIYAAA